MRVVWDKFRTLPEVLRRQITLRLGLGGATLFLFIIIWIATGEIILALPGLVLAIFLAASGVALAFRCIYGNYIRVTGMVKQIETTSIRKKPKSILLTVEDRVLQFPATQRIKNIAVGDRLTLYLSPTTPIYEQDGVCHIFTYHAVERSAENY